MTAPNAKDGFEKVLASGLRRGATAPEHDCADAEILAAYFERSLGTQESQRWEAHFSVCARCQEQLAALVRSEPAPEAARQPFRLLTWRWLTPLAAATAALVLWVVMRPSRPITDSAANVAQAPPAVSQVQRTPAESAPPQPAAAPADKAAAARDALSATVGEKRKAEADADAISKQTLSSRTDPARAKALSAASAPEPVVAKVQEETGPRKAPVGALDRQHVAETVQVQSTPAAPDREQKLDQRAAAAPAAPAPAQATTRANESRDEKARSIELADSAKKERQTFGALEMRPGVSATTAAPPQFATPDGKIVWRYAAGKLERSTDAGKTWKTSLTPAYAILAGACPKERVCWAVGAAGLVLRTSDGEKWETLPAPESANLIAITATDDKTAKVTTASGKSYQTSDAGKTWQVL